MTPTRYETDDLTEAQFEPGSRGQVLKNLLGISHKREMDALEAEKLVAATDWAIRHYSADHRFTAQDINDMHRQWLGEVYPWAGEYRQVNISKDGFPFAMSAQVPRLMDVFSRDMLRQYTPCNSNDLEEVAKALAVCHCELVLVHPFREGNGRVSRMLATLMALQADLPLLDFSGIYGKKRQAYFAAVQAGMGENYEPMKTIFRSVINRTLRSTI